ncbi:MAG TPA: cysteine hydrolase family protein [Cellulomonas sp.]
MHIAKNSALIVIDVQKGFDLAPVWGRRNNPDAERNIAALCEMWQATGRPVVCVRHTTDRVLSPFATWSPGRGLKPEVVQVRFNVTVEKSVNSSFLGTPDLHEWLRQHQIRQIVVVGIQTNMCVESTARTGGNLGYDVVVPLDATHTFDLKVDGRTFTADELAQATAANLAGGRFATVTSTKELLGGFIPVTGETSGRQEEIAGVL